MRGEKYIESPGLKNDKTGVDKPFVRPLQSPQVELPVILLDSDKRCAVGYDGD